MAVRTTVVGSWWTQPDYADQLARYHRDELDDESGETVLRAAATAAIKQQIDLGLDDWTGGEYFGIFTTRIFKVLTGVTLDRPETSSLADYDDFARVSISGDIDAPNGLGYVRAYAREKDLPGGVTKVTVPGPIELVPPSFDEDERTKLLQQLPNLIRIVNTELRALERAGCPHIQLDLPTVGILVSAEAMHAKAAADLIAKCFEGITVRKAVHICCGTARGKPANPNLHNAPWAGILEYLDGVIDVAALECTYFAQYQDRNAFKKMPQSMELAAGIISEASYWAEPVAKIRSRAEDWARVVGEERLSISVNCGFGGHPVRSIPLLREKVENMVEAASQV